MGVLRKLVRITAKSKARHYNVDLSGRVVYFPVRHHSPACAWHVRQFIRDFKPDSILIEGPTDASQLIPLLTHPETRLPVAIFATFVRQIPNGLPERHSAYYPLCEYSPEFAAITAAREVGAAVRFIDLTFPEMIVATHAKQLVKASNLFDERYFLHNRFLDAVCRRTGSRDADDLWDHLFELDFLCRDREDFVRNVLAYCSIARQAYSEDMLRVEGTLTREKAMAFEIAKERGKVLVVAGGFHVVALPETEPEEFPAVQAADKDAHVVLMRYGFEQLDRLNGYASGMPSPGYYQLFWDSLEGGAPEDGPENLAARIIVNLSRGLRRREQAASVADEIEAMRQVRGLAQLRGHMFPSREDILDGIRSVLVKGTEDVEGIQVLAEARKLLAGDRVGRVPPEAGLPPLVKDFQACARRLRLSVESIEALEVRLDLYRKSVHRETSRFLHRLRFLDVPFAEWLKGPDFVKGERLDRIQEVWKYWWRPSTDSTLIERSVYGANLEEAAVSYLLEAFRQAETQGRGRRADLAAELLLEAVRMGLHKQTDDLLERMRLLISEDSSFVSLVNAVWQLMILDVSREPLEAHSLTGVREAALAAYERACYVIPDLAAVPDDEESAALEALRSFGQAIHTLGDSDEHRELRRSALETLSRSPGGNPTMHGAATGLLHAEGRKTSEEVITGLEGHLYGCSEKAAQGPRFLVGLMATARNLLWSAPGIIATIHGYLKSIDEDQFVGQLPFLRLAFSDLTPQESHRTARAVAEHAGIADLKPAQSSEFSTQDMLQATLINRRVLGMLRKDGLEEFVD